MLLFISFLAYLLILSHSTESQAWGQSTKIQPSDLESGDKFGSSAALTNDFAFVGAKDQKYESDKQPDGSLYIFSRQGISWNETQKLTAPEATLSNIFCNFGDSVSISSKYLIVGAASTFNRQGRAYSFTKTGDKWILHQILKPNETLVMWDLFGSSVAHNDKYAVISAPGRDGTYADEGAAYVFLSNGTLWNHVQTLRADKASVGAYLGHNNSIAILGNNLLIGAPRQNILSFEKQGAVHVFSLVGNSWTFNQTLNSPLSGASLSFGSPIFIYGNQILVGSHQDRHHFRYTFSGTEFNQISGHAEPAFVSSPDGMIRLRRDVTADQSRGAVYVEYIQSSSNSRSRSQSRSRSISPSKSPRLNSRPPISKAYYSRDVTSIVVQFRHPYPLIHGSLSCDEVFSDDTISAIGSGLPCRIDSATGILQVLPATYPSLGTQIGVKKSFFEATYPGYSFEVAFAVLQKLEDVYPTIIAFAPTATLCANIYADVSSSMGGFRSFVYNWELLSPSPTQHPALSDLISSSNGPEISIPQNSEALMNVSSNETIRLRVNISNALGLSSSKEIGIERSLTNQPVADIRGPSTIKLGEVSVFDADAMVYRCDGGFSQAQVSWTLALPTGLTLSHFGLTNERLKFSSLQFLPSLPGDWSIFPFSITLTLTATNPQTKESTQVEKNISVAVPSVTIELQRCQATMTTTQFCVMRLSVMSVSKAIVPSEVEWSIMSSSAVANSYSLEISKFAFSADTGTVTSYEPGTLFVKVKGKIFGREFSETAIVAYQKIPSVALKLSVNQPRAMVRTDIPLFLSIDADVSTFPNSPLCTFEINFRPILIDSSYSLSNQFTLRINETLLQENTDYVLTVKAVCQGNTAIQSLEIQTVPAPTGGKLNVSPISGRAYNDTFTMSVVGVESHSDYMPLTYDFSYFDSLSRPVTLARGPRNTVSVILPPGNFTIQAIVCNTVRGCLTLQSSISVYESVDVQVLPQALVDGIYEEILQSGNVIEVLSVARMILGITGNKRKLGNNEYDTLTSRILGDTSKILKTSFDDPGVVTNGKDVVRASLLRLSVDSAETTSHITNSVDFLTKITTTLFSQSGFVDFEDAKEYTEISDLLLRRVSEMGNGKRSLEHRQQESTIQSNILSQAIDTVMFSQTLQSQALACGESSQNYDALNLMQQVVQTGYGSNARTVDTTSASLSFSPSNNRVRNPCSRISVSEADSGLFQSIGIASKNRFNSKGDTKYSKVYAVNLVENDIFGAAPVWNSSSLFISIPTLAARRSGTVSNIQCLRLNATSLEWIIVPQPELQTESQNIECQYKEGGGVYMASYKLTQFESEQQSESDNKKESSGSTAVIAGAAGGVAFVAVGIAVFVLKKKRTEKILATIEGGGISPGVSSTGDYPAASRAPVSDLPTSSDAMNRMQIIDQFQPGADLQDVEDLEFELDAVPES
eukprot:TRINITY_DN6638_c0_g1_i1.p1 TRINITY_DN6638_c0_g1~~TRINITY_DN6638_c0_g1_i1.p1  ORF type:complete len:1440 (-),score=270.95 TRINITY_DN6638_c0_g1_i1:217-4536(-)